MSDDRDPGNAPATSAGDQPAPGVDRDDRVHTFPAPGISVTWSRRRCTHVAVCVMNLPDVFAPGRRPWVDAREAPADTVARVVMRCPTGALHFARTDGAAGEAVPGTNRVLVARHGPIYLHGDVEVLDESGAPRLTDTRVALCRCGRTGNGPLCDGAHNAVGFEDPGAVADPAAVTDAGASDTRLRVRPEAGGPLRLEGPFTLVAGDGRTTLTGTRAALCRCGRSANKPFCDGSHERARE